MFRLPKASLSRGSLLVGQSSPDVEDCPTYGGAPHRFKLDFFGGTMFLVRPEALKPLRDLRLAADMPYERELATCRICLTSGCAPNWILRSIAMMRWSSTPRGRVEKPAALRREETADATMTSLEMDLILREGDHRGGPRT